MKALEATVRKTQLVARKRAHTIFGTYGPTTQVDEAELNNNNKEKALIEDHQQENYDEGPMNGEIYQSEKFLPNGDYYTGYWVDNVPQGQGKYWWTDGCMYVGDWHKGKMMGIGIFSWPSGAMYEGNFKNGYMDGEGTYTAPNGDTFRGSWLMDLKHGHGVKEYANGDCYDGEWCRGLQEKNGKYTWKNGNYYVGEWQNGAICGNGKLYWTNGKMYEGNWEDGLPKGKGTFYWADGSYYVGNWSRDPDELNGTFYPSESLLERGNFEWDPQQVFNVDLMGCTISPNDKVSVLPSQKKLAVRISKNVDNNNNVGNRTRMMSIDGSVDSELSRMQLSDGVGTTTTTTSISCSDMDAMVTLQEADGYKGGSPIRIPKIVKRQGITISKGHKNYELMLNLQLGIRHTVQKLGPTPTLDLEPSAFDPKEKYWTRFPPEGSKHTPRHQSCEFRWKDYCPKVFRALRTLFKVDATEYMLSICGPLRELSSPGKSGSFFYLTNDDRYMIKTMKKAEVKVLLRMLNAYYNHFRAFENTLVTRYYGLHCLKLNGPAQKKVRFVIIGNLFCTNYTIHRRFDLKGSTFGRITDKPESEIDTTTTLKDLDLNFIFRLQKSWFEEFLRQVDRDCELLEQERVMDYSLLVGVHFREGNATGYQTPSGCKTPIENGTTEVEPVHRFSRSDVDLVLLNAAGLTSTSLGVNMPARVERTFRKNDLDFQLVGEPTGELYDVTLFFGIIDILQDYDITKKLEHAYKSIQCDPNSISAVDPMAYSRRFRDYIFKVFVEDN
ncbi:hypothetical protein K7X08_007468 [Anisodus acutangulus]|uniref:Phosphatidylinositol 4-phosphate 5-kinase n=2 Tax=Anisodus TaxID=243963 RepID=A0A9Q1LCP6_9SOLA|nr:hypothetical protein K7X08_007468 [Anisodus acutangulus]KAK4345917.1 hypothetical protein RND71_036093 [Anisodus tanguticus]